MKTGLLYGLTLAVGVCLGNHQIANASPYHKGAQHSAHAQSSKFNVERGVKVYRGAFSPAQKRAQDIALQNRIAQKAETDREDARLAAMIAAKSMAKKQAQSAYQDGFQDGFEAGQESAQNTYPYRRRIRLRQRVRSRPAFPKSSDGYNLGRYR